MKFESWIVKDLKTFLLPIIFCVALICGLAYLLVSDITKQNSGDGVKTEVEGVTKIVEIETHGEKHEYLYYHRNYRGSLCHIPNCRYCKKEK